ncbi:hypothetical protein WDW37_10675 [Bdellovibrionota bacterium FG-1]
MKKFIVPVLMISMFSGGWALATEVNVQPGTAATDSGAMSQAKTSELKVGGLHDEVVGVSPQVGMVNYHDMLGNTGNRGTIGLTSDMNASTLISNVTDMPDLKYLFIGPQVGFFYSHIGSGTANFFGAQPSDIAASGDAGTNMFYIPLDLKVGMNYGKFRPSIHGGGNIYYRSVASSFALGANPDTSSSSSWAIYPNIGLDLEVELTRSVALIARPDVTLGGSNRIWSASLGATIPLG